MRRILVMAWCMAAVLLVGACGSDEGSGGSGSSDPIQIGFIGDLTGPVAPYSKASLEGARIAVDEANQAGGVDGRKLELKVYDDKNNPIQTVNIAKRAAPGAAALIVASGSANVLAAGPAIERAQRPFIVTVSSNPAVTESGWKWVNRVHLSDADQVQAVLAYGIEEKGLKRIALIHDTSDLGRGGQKLILDKLTDAGLKPVTDQSYAPETNDFSAQINALRDASPDGVAFWGTLDAGARIVDQMHAVGMKNVQFMGGGGLVSNEFIELAGDAAQGTVAAWAYVDPDNPTLKEMSAKYKSATQRDPDVFAAQSYDGARILVEALKQAGTDPEALQKAIRATQYSGAVGDITFDDKGQNQRTIHLGQVKDGEWELLK
ncbi:MAG TPA: ABC transporter substrate-binding protein [Solirubrobacter sp.]|nr:ABC transporter substrate-binding protein [Solirubrobacter sp.]